MEKIEKKREKMSFSKKISRKFEAKIGLIKQKNWFPRLLWAHRLNLLIKDKKMNKFSSSNIDLVEITEFKQYN